MEDEEDDRPYDPEEEYGPDRAFDTQLGDHGGRPDADRAAESAERERAGASEPGAQSGRGGEAESGSEISKIVQDQAGKIIDTRPKFNTNYSIKVKEKTYFPFPLQFLLDLRLFCFVLFCFYFTYS